MRDYSKGAKHGTLIQRPRNDHAKPLRPPVPHGFGHYRSLPHRLRVLISASHEATTGRADRRQLLRVKVLRRLSAEPSSGVADNESQRVELVRGLAVLDVVSPGVRPEGREDPTECELPQLRGLIDDGRGVSLDAPEPSLVSEDQLRPCGCLRQTGRRTCRDAETM